MLDSQSGYVAFVCFLHLLLCVAGIFDIPDVDPVMYIQDGDVMLGGQFRQHHYRPGKTCSDQIVSLKIFQYCEAFVYSLNTVGAQIFSSLNLTLGFVAFDDCQNEQVAIARGLQFIRPSVNCTDSWRNLDPENDSGDDIQREAARETRRTNGDSFPPHDVAGVISGSSSSQTIAMSGLLSLFKVPVLATLATSVELSDKIRFSKFARIVSSDYHQALAIVALMRRFSWSYVSLVCSQGKYGEGGAQLITDLASEMGICVFYTTVIKSSRPEYDTIARHLMSDPRAKVLVLFGHSYDAVNLINALRPLTKNPDDRLIMISGDGITPDADLADVSEVVVDSFFFDIKATSTSQFREYFENLSLHNSENPWLQEFVDKETNCRL